MKKAVFQATSPRQWEFREKTGLSLTPLSLSPLPKSLELQAKSSSSAGLSPMDSPASGPRSARADAARVFFEGAAVGVRTPEGWICGDVTRYSGPGEYNVDCEDDEQRLAKVADILAAGTMDEVRELDRRAAAEGWAPTSSNGEGSVLKRARVPGGTPMGTQRRRRSGNASGAACARSGQTPTRAAGAPADTRSATPAGTHIHPSSYRMPRDFVEEAGCLGGAKTRPASSAASCASNCASTHATCKSPS